MIRGTNNPCGNNGTGRHRGWTDEERDTLRRMAAGGAGVEDIARAVRRTESAVKNKVFALGSSIRRPHHSGPPQPPPAPPCPDLKPLVLAALAQDPAGWPPPPRNSLSRHQAAWPLLVSGYLARVELEVQRIRAAEMIGRTPGLIRYALRRVEDMRDDPAFDAFMDRLGEQVRELAA